MRPKSRFQFVKLSRILVGGNQQRRVRFEVLDEARFHSKLQVCLSADTSTTTDSLIVFRQTVSTETSSPRRARQSRRRCLFGQTFQMLLRDWVGRSVLQL